MPRYELIPHPGSPSAWAELGPSDFPPLPPPCFVGRLDTLRDIDHLLQSGPGVAAVWGPAGVGKTTLMARWIFTRPGEAEVWWIHCPDGRGDLGLVELAGRRGLPLRGGLSERLRSIGVYLRSRPCLVIFDGGAAGELRLPDLAGVKRVILTRRRIPLPGLELLPLGVEDTAELTTRLAPKLLPHLPPCVSRPAEVYLRVGLVESGVAPQSVCSLEFADLLPLLLPRLMANPFLHRCLGVLSEVGVPVEPGTVVAWSHQVDLGDGSWSKMRMWWRQSWGRLRRVSLQRELDRALRCGVIQVGGGGRLTVSAEVRRLVFRGMGSETRAVLPPWFLPPGLEGDTGLSPLRPLLMSMVMGRSNPLDKRGLHLGRWLVRALEESGDGLTALEVCQELLDRGGIQGDPGELQGRAGRLAMKAGKHEQARALLGEALTRLEQAGERGLPRARVLLPLAALDRQGGQVEQALARLAEVERVCGQFPEDGMTRAACQVEQARCYIDQERWGEAEARLQFGAGSSFVGLAPTEILVVRQMAARVQEELEHPREAEVHYREVLVLLEGQNHAPRGTVADTCQGLARSLAASGQPAEALPYMLRSVAIRTELGEPRALGESLRSLGLCYKALGQQAEARSALERSIQVVEAGPRVDPVFTSVTRFNLAQVLVDLGQLETALGVFEEAARVVDEVLEVSHSLRCACHHAMGRLLVRLGRAGEAIPHLKQGVEGRTLVPPADVASLSAIHHDLGLALLGSDRASEAEGPFREALALREKDLPTSSGQTSETLAALGQCVQRQGRLEEATTLLLRALELSEATAETHWTAAALACSDLGRLLTETGRVDEAQPTLRRVLVLQERMLGPDHPVIAVTLTSLAQIYTSRGRASEALSLTRRALSLREATLGPEQPETLHSLHRFGRALTAAGEVEKGVDVLGRAVVLHEKVFGEEAPPTVGVLYSLGQSMLAAGRPGLALAPLQKVVTVERMQKGETLAPALFAMGQTYAALARHGEAVQVLQEALKLEETPSGSETHPVGVAATLHELGGALLATGQPSRALVHFRRALAVWEKELGEEHPSTINTRVELGHTLLAEGKSKQALAQYERAQAAQEKASGAGSPRLVNQLLQIGQHLARRGRLDEGLRWVEKAAAAVEISEDHTLKDKVELVLGSILVIQDPAGDGELRIQKVVDHRLDTMGIHHPEVAQARLVAAEVRLGRGHFVSARERLTQALVDLREGGQVALDVESSLLGALAQAWSSAGEGAQAAHTLMEKLKVDERRLGSLHASLATTRHELGCAWYVAGEYQTAAAALREAVVGRRRHLGADHPATWMSRVELARVEIGLGTPGAKTKMDEAISNLSRLLGDEHPHVVLLRMQMSGRMD